MKKYLIYRLVLLIILIICLMVYYFVAYPKQQAGKHFNLAAAAFDQNDFQTAINEYRKALEYKPDVPEIYHNLTLAYIQAGQFDSAIESGLKSLQLTPTNAEMHYYLGIAYEQKNLNEQAIAEYRKYLEVKPTGEFATEAQQQIAVLKEKLYLPQTVEEKLEKVNRDLDMINEVLRRQHAK
ncbi:MAG: tetratricopeptide repeat protein [bacterium]|nr:tetratricopeptide repeat protein [bacterium]